MTKFLLVRHAKPDYTEIDIRKYRAFGNDLASLSDEGLLEVEELSKNDILADADLIITSPYTRTMHTAALLSKKFNIDFKVELDLMEWIPDKSYMYDDYANVVKWRNHYDENNGKNHYPEDNFEEKSEIIARTTNVLKKYNNLNKVIVVTHGMVINALTGKVKPQNTEVIPYTL